MVHTIETLGASYNEKWNISIVQAKNLINFQNKNIKLIPTSTENMNKWFQKLFSNKKVFLKIWWLGRNEVSENQLHDTRENNC